MTSYVLGNNTSMLAVGVSDMNGVPTPFISVVDVSKINISDAEFVEGKDECDDMVRRIKEAGGVVIHIHNPIAAFTPCWHACLRTPAKALGASPLIRRKLFNDLEPVEGPAQRAGAEH